jgi:hypothetical protein
MEAAMRNTIIRMRIRMFMVMFTGLLLIVAFIGMSCAGEDSTTPVQTPTPIRTTGTPPIVEWSPDGNIQAGEYDESETYGNYEVHWMSDEEYIYVGMKARTSGFVAVGFQPGSRMKNADMVFGIVKDGQVAVHDMFSTGDFGPHPLDTKLGGTDDIIDFGGIEDGEYTVIEFQRALVTGDDYDNPLSAGENGIIWAYGSSDSLTFKHSNKGYGKIDL